MRKADVSGEAVMAVEWSLFIFGYILVALRIGVRLARQQSKHVILSDVFLVVSALVCLGLITCDTLTYTLGAMKAETATASEITADDMAKQILLDKVSFASNYFYDTGMYFPKGTILSLYFKLFPQTMPGLRVMLYVVTGYTIICGITTCGLDTFFCHNISDNWSLEEGACSSFNSLLVLQVDWAMNFSSDILIFALPFPLLRNLQLKKRQLYGLVITFALGIVTIAVNLARFISIQVGSSWNGLYIWSMAEMSVAIMVVSLPALKVLLKRWKKSSQMRSNSYYTSRNNARGHNQISCSLADDTGSDVELNRITKDDEIMKTKEVSVDSRPLSSDRPPYVAQIWDADTRPSRENSRP